MKINKFQFQNYPNQNNPLSIAITEIKCDFIYNFKIFLNYNFSLS